jgi:hypothetical protein
VAETVVIGPGEKTYGSATALKDFTALELGEYHRQFDKTTVPDERILSEY